MPSYQEKITRYTKKQKTYFEETYQVSELDPSMAGILELLDREFKISMITMLRLEWVK